MTERLDENSPSWSRRRLMAVGSVGALGAVGLAACSSDSSSGDAPSASAGGAATTGSSGAATGGTSTGTKLAKLSDVPVGQAIVLDAGSDKILLAQPKEGTAVAFSAICTHQGCTVSGGAEAKCPCHGSRFDIATGAVKNGPATKALPAVAVSVNDDGEVVLGD